MGYTELLRRAAEIAWRRRWLWLLALFAGETGGGLSSGTRGFNVPTIGPGGGSLGTGTPGQNPPLPNLGPLAQWLIDQRVVIIVIGLALLAVYVILFVVSCVAVAAIIRGVEEIDGGRPIGLGRAWGLGAAGFSHVLRLRLLLLLQALLAVVILGGLVVLGIAAAIYQAWAALAIVIYEGLGLAFVYALFALVLTVLLPVATRAIVLDAFTVWRGLGQAYQLLLARTRRVLACWGLMVACQIVYGIVVGVGSALLVLPVVAVVAAMYTGGHLAAAIVVGLVFGAIVLAVLLVAGSAFAAFFSSFWTLAYRRLDAA